MSDHYDYSDDFISDTEDTRKPVRGQSRYNGTDIDNLSKYNGSRRESEDFWATPRGHSINNAESLHGLDVAENVPRSRILPSATGSRAYVASTRNSRVTISRGLTHIKAPASKIQIIEINERPVMQYDHVLPKMGTNPRLMTAQKVKTVNYRQPITTQSHGRGRQGAKSKGRGRGRGSSQRSSQRSSPRMDNVTQRLLSANRYKISELRNQVSDSHIYIKDLQEENKLLKKMQYRHEKALNKFENQEGDLPKLIQRHNNELKTVQDQLRNSREKYERTERYLRDAEDDLERVTGKMKKYKSLAERKGLPERDDLNRKLSKAELDMEEKDSKIKELTRYIENLNKNHRHELGVEIARHRDTKRQLDQVNGDKDALDYRLKEREKELDIKNIYSNRARGLSKQPASYSGTPLDSPSPSRRRIPSITEMTARERAKMFELKRREEAKKKKSKPKIRSFDLFDNRNTSYEEERNDRDDRKVKLNEESKFLKELEAEDVERERERERELIRERERENEREREREQEEEDYRRARERLKKESEEFENLQRERREKEQKERRDIEERRSRDNRERRDREDRERKEREERIQKEKMNMERERREKEEAFEKERQNELAEREVREKNALEMEERAKEERRRLENDPRRKEEQKKKDILLARLKAIDAGGSKETTTPQNRSPFDDTQSTTSSKKSYTFSKPTENLHNGKPAHEDYNRNSGIGDFGGYNPSFSSGDNSSKVNKKTALMNELFGGQTSTSNNESDTLFFAPDTKKQSNKRVSGFPWDDDKSSTNSASKPQPRENSSTLFGGGAALVDDEAVSSKSKLLPRRNRHQTNTFSAKPTVMVAPEAIFDDDIEEVVL